MGTPPAGLGSGDLRPTRRRSSDRGPALHMKSISCVADAAVAGIRHRSQAAHGACWPRVRTGCWWPHEPCGGRCLGRGLASASAMKPATRTWEGVGATHPGGSSLRNFYPHAASQQCDPITGIPLPAPCGAGRYPSLTEWVSRCLRLSRGRRQADPTKQRWQMPPHPAAMPYGAAWHGIAATSRKGANS